MANDNQLMIAIESGMGRLESGQEVRFIRGHTKLRASDETVRRWPQFFAPVDATDDEIAAARAPIEAHFNAASEKADRAFRAEQALTETPRIPDDRAVEVLEAFVVGSQRFERGMRFDRDHTLVKSHPQFFATPRRPLVAGARIAR